MRLTHKPMNTAQRALLKRNHVQVRKRMRELLTKARERLKELDTIATDTQN